MFIKKSPSEDQPSNEDSQGLYSVNRASGQVACWLTAKRDAGYQASQERRGFEKTTRSVWNLPGPRGLFFP